MNNNQLFGTRTFDLFAFVTLFITLIILILLPIDRLHLNHCRNIFGFLLPFCVWLSCETSSFAFGCRIVRTSSTFSEFCAENESTSTLPDCTLTILDMSSLFLFFSLPFCVQLVEQVAFVSCTALVMRLLFFAILYLNVRADVLHLHRTNNTPSEFCRKWNGCRVEEVHFSKLHLYHTKDLSFSCFFLPFLFRRRVEQVHCPYALSDVQMVIGLAVMGNKLSCDIL